jgi:hypothetical protein
MKIIIEQDDGRQSIIDDVMDYSILCKEDLEQAVNDHFEDDEIDKEYADLDEETKTELWSRVRKNCSYFDSLPSMEEFRGEVYDVMRELELV